MVPSSRSRKRWWLTGMVFAAVVLLNESVTRGYVTDGEGRPIAGADVLLADSSSIIRIAKTDAAGYFRVMHLPFARLRWSMLICAPGHSAHYIPHASSAIIRSQYGIGAYSGLYPTTPAELGWQAPVVPSCPGGPVAPSAG
jgi:hypothetical protein